ncbi:hypothetical protein CFP65_7531 [Kitasatospora sp. MMS16-BH015]|uniref:hypothetical protein n=1 Tax=Kitasatospora sp. MMS16-BH015 TaxID=2018025 RepID=UPI000CA224FA|nr:hypothetical protein [Kitasatospora sp. MMS16-BH015]AUG82105.1 hypothetical protein CFP65_7531 [Kitasatospora sp. MMS16-BH015]
MNPLDAPQAVEAAAEPLEELLDDCNHVTTIGLFHVVPAADRPPLPALAQAVYDAGPFGHQVGTPITPFDSPSTWRDLLRQQVTTGILQPSRRYADPTLRTPAELRRTAELADALADLVESHLGPVRTCAEISGPYLHPLWSQHLLLVTDHWATVLGLGLDH